MVVRDSNLRPLPPSPEAIIQDVSNAPSSDPVFRRLCEITDLQYVIHITLKCMRLGSDSQHLAEPPLKDVGKSNSNTPSDLDISYRKVRELLDNLSSLQTGKDRLNEATEELLSCKKDVSAMSLELKTRLETHKIASRPARSKHCS